MIATGRVPADDLKRLYAPPREPVLVTVPPLAFLMIDGQGDPNTSPAYQEAVAALYALSYGITFALKKERGPEYRVGPLEGLWWAEDMTAFSVDRRADWQWTMMIAQPDEVTPGLLDRVREDVQRKKGLVALPKVRLEIFDEGLAAQVLHIGPYSAEGPTIARLHAFIREEGCRFDDRRPKHHEIYLSDPRRTAPERLKTVIRQPVVRGEA